MQWEYQKCPLCGHYSITTINLCEWCAEPGPSSIRWFTARFAQDLSPEEAEQATHAVIREYKGWVDRGGSGVPRHLSELCTWDTTPEGYDFWAKLYAKYTEDYERYLASVMKEGAH